MIIHKLCSVSLFVWLDIVIIEKRHFREVFLIIVVRGEVFHGWKINQMHQNTRIT